MTIFKKILLFTALCLLYIFMIYLTFHAVAKVHGTNDPIFAKKIVILTFFLDVFLFAGSGYLVYKLKFPMNEK
ncbi:MAG: hypothetical protein AYP45_14975 [Candidatus Brocadia carolinensis]|uniref:Uncharacterized protein n=1 Tax=Candidatus Brocadia carolinensis TaxID=1004156 RepID=A0A1V4AQG2_9BACT|nr:MAG: hypothetical protein AYP45_14975 [Candidatus Brocadia caroliniensis]